MVLMLVPGIFIYIVSILVIIFESKNVKPLEVDSAVGHNPAEVFQMRKESKTIYGSRALWISITIVGLLVAVVGGITRGMSGSDSGDEDKWGKQDQQLSTTNSCIGCDMSGGNFAGYKWRFSHKDLTDINLTGAILKEKYFVGSNLTRANLTGANLTGANLWGVNLTDANLSRANLTKATLTNVNFTGANLTEAVLDVTWNAIKATYCRTTMPDGTVNNSGC
jgi:hypothetical protein